MKTRRSISVLVATLFAAGAVLQGCGDDSDANPKPPDDVTPIAGSSAEGGSDGTGGTKGAAGNDQGEGGTGNTGATGGAPIGGEGGAPNPQPECPLPELGEDGCFNCPKNGAVDQWLNRCVESDCEPFDNSKTRLPLIKADGTLPPLPT